MHLTSKSFKDRSKYIHLGEKDNLVPYCSMSGTLKISYGELNNFLMYIQGRVPIFVRLVSWSSWRCVVALFPLTMQAFGELSDLGSCIISKLIHILSIHDALLSRLSNDDDMERNLSTFANEMTSSAMILGK